MKRVFGSKEKRSPAFYIIAGLLAVLFVGIVVILYRYKVLSDNESNDLKVDAKIISDISDMDFDDYTINDYDDNLLRVVNFEELLSINSNVKYWVYIPDIIDTYVMQAPADVPGYYDSHNIYKNQTLTGCLSTPADNVEGLTDAHLLIQGNALNGISVYLDKKYAANRNKDTHNDKVYIYTEDCATSYYIYSIIEDTNTSNVFTSNLMYMSDEYKDVWSNWVNKAPYTGVHVLPEYTNDQSVLVLSAYPKGASSSYRYYLVCIPYETFVYADNCLFDEDGNVISVMTEDERWNYSGELYQLIDEEMTSDIIESEVIE